MVVILFYFTFFSCCLRNKGRKGFCSDDDENNGCEQLNRKCDKQLFILKCIHCYSIFRVKWCDKLFKLFMKNVFRVLIQGAFKTTSPKFKLYLLRKHSLIISPLRRLPGGFSPDTVWLCICFTDGIWPTKPWMLCTGSPKQNS